MNNADSKNMGLKRIHKKYRKLFAIPENTEHYSADDYKTAERKFIKYALTHGEDYNQISLEQL